MNDTYVVLTSEDSNKIGLIIANYKDKLLLLVTLLLNVFGWPTNESSNLSGTFNV